SARMGKLGFLRTKVSRLLLPWVLWSLIYLAMQWLERLRHGESLTEGFSPWMVLGGTYEHLWFVPFALLGAVLISLVQELTLRRDHARMMLLALGVGAALTLADAWIIKAQQVPWPFLQWLFALPAIPFGFALGRAVIGADRALLVRSAQLALGAAIVCFACALFLPIPDMVRRYALSMLIVGAAFVWPGGVDPFSQRVAPLLFGVYLSHPMLERIYQGLHLPELGIAPFAALVFFASCVLVVVFRRGPLRHLV
ncbi:MAG TPA: acyltransferase family protein, partial [Polyangiaceae bacterium]|nr:acyltransferase family protein [Polyangiaceae bacterium]